MDTKGCWDRTSVLDVLYSDGGTLKVRRDIIAVEILCVVNGKVETVRGVYCHYDDSSITILFGGERKVVDFESIRAFKTIGAEALLDIIAAQSNRIQSLKDQMSSAKARL